MSQLVIDDEQLARQLRVIAEREQRTVEEVLSSLVARYYHEQGAASAQPGASHQNTLRALGEVLAEARFASGHSDISERSREILDSEFADYLLSRSSAGGHDAGQSSNR